MSADPKDAIAVTCSCGGWVMLAVIGRGERDRAHFREAGKLAAEGYTVRTPVPIEEARQLTACARNGACIHDDPAQLDALEAIP